MPLFAISYDLQRPDFTYTDLFTALEQRGARRVLQSTWALRGAYTVEALRDDLLPFIAEEDRLFVTQVERWGACNALTSPREIPEPASPPASST